MWYFLFLQALISGSMQVVSSYFPLSQCIKGLKVLVESLFGATFHNIPLASGESWHPDVIKMSLHHPDEVNTILSCHVHFSFSCLSVCLLVNFK